MSVYVTRHGQTDWNVLKKVQGRVDTDLNDNGKNQALEVRNKFHDVTIDLIFSSPLKRAVQTAEIIKGDRDVPIILEDKIIERDFGEFEGTVSKEMDLTFWDYQGNYDYMKAENIRVFFDRVYTFLDELKEKYFDKDVLLVIHGGVSIPIYCYFNGVPEDGNLFGVALKNCEYAKYEFK